MKINKLYSDPEVFSPIVFHEGVNLILGEKVSSEQITTRQHRKTNGVGKSLSIEFINFCLLKTYRDSRVKLIPDNVLPKDTKIFLDVQIGAKEFTICRTPSESDKPIFIFEDKDVPFPNVQDAVAYLAALLFKDKDIKNDICPSFREIMGPLIRDEASEFKELLRCYDMARSATERNLAKPHLYFFDINIRLIDELEKKLSGIAAKKAIIKDIKNNLTTTYRIKMNDVKAQINTLKADLKKIKLAVERYEMNEAYESIQDDIAQIGSELDELRTKQVACRYELQKIKSLPKMERINKKDMEIVFNQFKDGLGTRIVKELEETIAFKKRVERFQANLMKEKTKNLNELLKQVTDKIKYLEAERAKKMIAIDNKGLLKDVKNAYSIYESKTREYHNMQSQYEEYERKNHEKRILEQEQGNLYLQLDTELYSIKKTIESFNETIVKIHEYIMGSSEASFDMKVITDSRKVVQFEMRIHDDGSRSVNREKVFIYDMALMFNNITSLKHPHFLIHDNIFDVDQDTLIQSLNFLNDQESKHYDFQYILTLNRDKIEAEEKSSQIYLDIGSHTIASFTKKDRFLRVQYQEL